MSAASGPASGVWAPGRRRMTAGLVVTITLFASEALAVATVMPKVADDLGRSGYGAAFSAFFLGSIAGVLAGGPAADRWGPARPFAAAVGLFAAGLGVSGTASAMVVLVGGRVLQGLGSGAATPVVYAVIGRAYPEAARVRMFAVIATAWVLPGVVGPGLAGLVAEHAGWRAVFVGLLPLVLAAAVVALPPLVGLRRPPASEAVPLSPRRVAAVAGAALRLRAGLPAAVAVRGLLTCAFSAVDLFLPLAITALRGRSLLYASLAVTLTTLVWTVGAWLAERLMPRWGGPRLVRCGLVLLVAGIGGELLLLAPDVPLAAGLAGAAVAGLGIGLAHSPLSALVLAASLPGREGSDSSALALFDNLGLAAGPAITGLLVGLDGAGWSDRQALLVGWVIAAGIGLVGLAASARLRAAVPRQTARLAGEAAANGRVSLPASPYRGREARSRRAGG